MSLILVHRLCVIGTKAEKALILLTLSYSIEFMIGCSVAYAQNDVYVDVVSFTCVIYVLSR